MYITKYQQGYAFCKATKLQNKKSNQVAKNKKPISTEQVGDLFALFIGLIGIFLFTIILNPLY